MDEAEALCRFTGSDERAARSAFDWLVCRGRPFVLAWLARTGTENRDDREEIAQEVFRRAWSARERFQPQGVGAWYRFLQRTASRCRIDRHRSQPTGAEPLAAADVPDDELPLVDAVLGALSLAAQAGDLRRLADVLWLGLDLRLTERGIRRRVLAAQLYYLDGESWEQVLRLLPPESPADPPPDRATLDTWLSDPGVLRALARETLYFPGDRLAAYLLRAMAPGELDELERRAHTAARPHAPGALWAAPVGWSWTEVRLVLWRCRHALTRDEILARSDCPCSPADLDEHLVRIEARLPFNSEMAGLLQRLQWLAAAERRRIFGAPGLWQRLAFDYCYVDGLPQRDAHQRLAPPAALVEYRVTAGMLNMWISGKRLVQRLAEYCRAQGLDTGKAGAPGIEAEIGTEMGREIGAEMVKESTTTHGPS